jgi:hypothetical protein
MVVDFVFQEVSVMVVDFVFQEVSEANGVKFGRRPKSGVTRRAASRRQDVNLPHSSIATSASH